MENRNFKNLLAVFGLIAACISFYFLLLRSDWVVGAWNTAWSILTPIVYGVVMAYLLNPIMKFVQPKVTDGLTGMLKSDERAKRWGKGVAIAASILFGIAVITVICLMIIPELSQSIAGMVKALPDQITEFGERLENLRVDEQFQQYLDTFTESVVEFLRNFYNNGLLNLVSNFAGYLATGVIGVFKFVFNFFIGIMVAIFALSAKETFIAQSKKLLYAVFKPEHANNILDTMRHGHRIFGGFLLGKIIDSIIIGIICYVCMLLMKQPYALLISIFVGVTNIVPIFGPFIGAIPSTILIVLVDPLKAVYFVIFILILQQVDGNIIGPKILGDTTGLDEFWVIVALMLCGGLWGLTGMIIGVPLFATLYYIVKRVVERILRKKEFPLETEAYRNVDCYDRSSGKFVMGIDETLAQEKREYQEKKKSRKKKQEPK
ncbi:MAG: AI-2E family transporter [Lachnospiraceae bacterium]|nr:AI-2E family transporter [Lachnospiraceae bacterium]